MTSEENNYVEYARDEVGFGVSQELMIVAGYQKIYGFASCPADSSYVIIPKERLEELQTTMSSLNPSRADITDKNRESVSKLVLETRKGNSFVSEEIFQEVVKSSGFKTE